MLTPRYYFADDFRTFYSYFLSQPHTTKIFHKGECLWRAGQPYDRIHYFVSGAAIHFLLTIHQPASSGLVIAMTQEDLADILGMSRVQITRELTELRSRGILTTMRGKLTITNLSALRALCTDEII